MMRAAVELAARKIPLEASGNVNLDTVASIAATGVDFISVGALTHSVKALDVSLDLRATPMSQHKWLRMPGDTGDEPNKNNAPN